MININTKQQIEDFTNGCCFYATGGGGPPLFGQKMLNEALDAGKQIRIIEANELTETSWSVCPYLMGSSGPETEDTKKVMRSFGLTDKTVTNMPSEATKLLVEQYKANLDVIIPLELGGAATASALATAAWLDLPTLNGDYLGRALPEISQIVPAVNKVNLLPIASCDAYGNKTIIKDAINLQMMERIGKYLSSASFGLIGQACLLKELKEVKPHIIMNTLSQALAVGETLRQVRDKEYENAIDIILKATKSKILFRGQIVKSTAQEIEGYYIGETYINGTDDFKKNHFKVWFKNEFILSWLNDKSYVACPDLITMVDANTYLPIINSQLVDGMNVIVFGLPAPLLLRSDVALKALGPNHFGFDFQQQFL